MTSSLWVHVFEPNASNRATRSERILDVDDQLLCNVDESTGQVARVSSTKRRIDEALASTRRCNEVFEHCEAFTEVALDRTRNHVATWVRHKTAHTCDLADLHHVSSST